jgi:hypothetical protein
MRIAIWKSVIVGLASVGSESGHLVSPIIALINALTRCERCFGVLLLLL